MSKYTLNACKNSAYFKNANMSTLAGKKCYCLPVSEQTLYEEGYVATHSDTDARLLSYSDTQTSSLSRSAHRTSLFTGTKS